MALAGDAIEIIDRSSPWKGATGRVLSGEFRGRYLVELDGAEPRARVELDDGQFIVTRAAPDAAALTGALRPFAEAALRTDRNLPDATAAWQVGDHVITLGDLRRAARLCGVTSR